MHEIHINKETDVEYIPAMTVSYYFVQAEWKRLVYMSLSIIQKTESIL